MILSLYPQGGVPRQHTLASGWNALTPDLGAWHIPGAGTQLRARQGGWYRLAVGAWGPHEGYLPPRAILTIRPDSPAPTLGLLRPFGAPWDFNAPGGGGIEPCGTPGTVHDHDAVMQRMPVGLFDMATGELRQASKVPTAGYYALTRGWGKVTQLPEFCYTLTGDQYDDRRTARDVTPIPSPDIRQAVLDLLPYDGQHLVRALRFAVLRLDDPFVQMDLRAIHRDCEVAWNDAVSEAILAGPRGQASPDCGREFGWVGYLAAIVNSLEPWYSRVPLALDGGGLRGRIRRIAKHVQHRDSKLLQRLRFGSFYGSPDPWGPVWNPDGTPAGGSGVPRSTDVAQGIEACIQVVALEALGLKREAIALAQAVLRWPTRKWLATDTADGVGYHGSDAHHARFALGALSRIAPRFYFEYAARWPVPKSANLGGTVGPFPDPAAMKAALIAMQNPGVTRWELEALR